MIQSEEVIGIFLIASSLNVDFVFVSSFVKGIEFVTHGVSGTSSVLQCSCR